MPHVVRSLVMLVFLSLPLWVEAFNFPIIRCTTTAQDGAGTLNHAIPNPPCSESGDLVIVSLATNNASTTTWPSATYCVGDAFTSLQADTSDTGNSFTYTIRYCILDAAMSGTNNVTTGTSVTAQVIVLVIVKGSYAGTPEAGTPFVQSVADSTVDPPSLTPSWGSADNLWIIAVGQDGAGRPELSRTTANAGWNLGAHYFSAGTTVVATGLFFNFFTAASLDPGGGLVALQSNNEHIDNLIAIKGQAMPVSGSTAPPCIISSIERTSCQPRERLP